MGGSALIHIKQGSLDIKEFENYCSESITVTAVKWYSFHSVKLFLRGFGLLSVHILLSHGQEFYLQPLQVLEITPTQRAHIKMHANVKDNII